MNITIYGAGYVGLVTGTCLAELGHYVLCIDIDAEKIRLLNAGECPIYEPGMLDLLRKNLHVKKIQFSHDFKMGVNFADVQFICVNTPASPNGTADISRVLKAAQTIAEYMENYHLIINKSTAPIGTVKSIQTIMQATLKQRQKQISFDVASNPEFLKEGAAINDFLEPDRIVFGTNSEKAEKILREIYQSFAQEKLISMDIASAELTKYAANAMLATKISFINEIANLAERVGANIDAVRKGISLDPRIGPHFINPGCGYGGSCFPKDVQALIQIEKEHGLTPHVLEAVERTNQHQKLILFHKLKSYFSNLAGRHIAVWGLAFKPDTNDIREASSRTIIEALWQENAIVQAYDPIAMPGFKREYPNTSQLMMCETKEKCLEGADALVIVTEWEEFKKADLKLIKNTLKHSVIFDGRNILDPIAAKNHGLKYFGIGK